MSIASKKGKGLLRDLPGYWNCIPTINTFFKKQKICLCAMLLISVVGYTRQTADTIQVDSIEKVFNPGTSADTVRLNEIIGIKIRTDKPITSYNTLYLNGIRVDQLKPWKSSQSEKTVFFQLDGGVKDLTLKFIGEKATNNNFIPVYFSVGDASQSIQNTTTPIYFLVKQKIETVWVWIMLTGLIVFIVIALRKKILKDDNNLYYSLGRAQLFFWTLIFVFCYLLLCMRTDTLPDIPSSILVILGISFATTAAAKLVENEVNKKNPGIDPNAKSEGFFNDILSDGSGINVHRFQNVVFNVLFGVIFIQRTFANQLLPNFDDNVLLLLGLSSGAFAGLKITEAQKEQQKPSPVGADTGKKEPVDKIDVKILSNKETVPGTVN